jgi:pimeloyl-ACP methyl ester carboxylesterase
MRGRGDLQYAKNSATYNPMQYVQDVNALFDELKIDRFVVVGTSLGGLMAMLFAMIDAKRIAGAVLNDIGPVIEPSGLARIRDTWGRAQLSYVDARRPRIGGRTGRFLPRLRCPPMAGHGQAGDDRRAEWPHRL